MAVEIINNKNFESTISKKGIVLVDFWAPWCGPCRQFAPLFEKIAEKYPKHMFGKINTQEEKELLKNLGIEHIPSIMLFRDGVILLKQPGYFEEEKLADIIKQAETIDMEKVREQMEKELKEKSVAV
jgi:thioredoxin 1